MLTGLVLFIIYSLLGLIAAFYLEMQMTGVSLREMRKDKQYYTPFFFASRLAIATTIIFWPMWLLFYWLSQNIRRI
jgi:hypothetical protein